MTLCIGEPLTPPEWTGLPLRRFAPPGHGTATPVAAVQDSLFVWNDGACGARVRWADTSRHYQRKAGVLDIMALDDEVFIEHDRPESPGSCLLVALPIESRERFAHRSRAELPALRSTFGLVDVRLERLARELERQCLLGEPYGRLYTSSISDALISHISTYSLLASPSEHRASKKTWGGRMRPEQRATVFAYIQDHLDADIDLDELALLLGCSRQHFVRLFKRTFSLSPYQFVIDMRIERAKLLIRRSRLPLAEIATSCGFFDQSHFSTCFARRVGLSPSRYRSQAA